MAVGVFGKLPARRDYVQHGVDRRLMQVFDPWLQACMAESKCNLGQRWLDAWLCAPIWRFWLGRRIAGVPVLGAMMPSVDGVGRYFPLCVLGAYEDLCRPHEDEQVPWFGKVESLMLNALAEGGTYEGLLAGLESLPLPVVASPQCADPDAPRPGNGVRGALSAVGSGIISEPDDGSSWWWVPAPDGSRPMHALIRSGLPAPADYAGLIAPEGVVVPAAGGS